MDDRNFLTATRTVETVESPINGEIKVIRSLGFGTYIQVEGLTQSGGVIVDVWKAVLKKVKRRKSIVNECLILGLGGGSNTKLVRKFWLGAVVTGVDIDPIMVKLGKKYLGLDKIGVNVEISDALEYCRKAVKNGRKYDLILIDLYIGYQVPEKFNSEKFAFLVKSLVAEDGIAVFNRLYVDKKRTEAVKFGKKLERVFSKVDYFYPEANMMFVCES